MAHQSLISMAVARVRSGDLPCFDASKVYAGRGHDETCGVCSAHIGVHQAVYEVEPGEPRPENLFMHVLCYQAWLEACREMPSEGAA
jgi:hypothetical protein